MALIENPLLTIAIPTFNREKFLDQCLKSIAVQVENRNFPIELIVSDNCSTDNTTSIVNQSKLENVALRYIRNVENKGPDFNIAQCYLEARGKFVLILGDDDFLIEGSIEKIIQILKRESDAGIIYLKGKPYNDDFKIIEEVNNSGEYHVYHDKEQFVKAVHYNLTFISGNVVNKELFKDGISKDFYNSYLLQLSWVLPIFIRSKNNVVVIDDILGIGSTDNTGGYKLQEVFAKNFNTIMTYFLDKGLQKSFISIINRNLLLLFFPGFLVKERMHSQAFSKVTSEKLFRTQFKNYLTYWTVIFPILALPGNLYKYWFYIIHYYNKLRAYFLELRFANNVSNRKVSRLFINSR